MPPIDTRHARRGAIKAYGCGKRCCLFVDGKCRHASVVDMDRVGARLQLLDACPLACPGNPRQALIGIEGIVYGRLGGPLDCAVTYVDGAVVVVHFAKPLDMGLVEMQQILAGIA